MESFFLSSIFLSSNPAEGPEGDEFSSDVHPLDVPQRCVLKKASQVCFKLVKVAAEGGNPEGGVRKNQEQLLRPHPEPAVKDFHRSDNLVFAAEEMHQGLFVEVQIQPRSPVAQDRHEQIPEVQSGALRLHIALIVHLKSHALLMREGCVDEFMFDEFTAEVDQLAVGQFEQQQIVQQLRAMPV